MVSKGLYPFSGQHFDRQGIRLHYLDEGSGSPLVMLHGNPTWSFYYRRLVMELRPEYRCVVPDHIGCGYSDKPGLDRYEYTLEARIADFTALMDHLELGRVTLVLHDWGGMIGLAWAVRYPERVDRLILMNTAGFPLPANKPLPWLLWLGRNTRLGAWLITRCNAFCRSAARIAVTQPLAPEVRAGYLAPYASASDRLAVLQFVRSIPLQPADPGYAIVKEVSAGLARFRSKPCLILWGMKDFVFDHHFLREWQHYLPDAEIHRFAAAGHYVLEDAYQAILPRIRDFLAREQSGP